MSKSVGYALIIIGVLLLAYNLGYLNLSMLTQPLSLPIIMIGVGVLEIVLKYLDFGDAGKVLQGIAGFILVIAIIFNISNLVSHVGVISMYPQDPVLLVNNSEYTCKFCESDAVIVNNKLRITHDGTIYDSNYSSNNYVVTNLFSESDYNFLGLNTVNGSLNFDNKFGSSNVNNIFAFSEADFTNDFGSIEIHTGPINGELTVYVSNNFGSVDLYVDENAAYLINAAASLGSVNNYVGLRSSNYDTAANKIRIVGDARFGSLNIYKE